MEVLLAIIVTIMTIIISCTSAILRWNEIRYRNKRLPPGTMGWPFFGETSEFLKHGPIFMTNQSSRYGKFFKSHIFGSPTVISMDLETNRYILLNEIKGLVAGYPESMLNILGRRNIAAVHGADHKYIRGALLSLITPTVLSQRILPTIDRFMRGHLSHWGNLVVDIQEKTKEMAFFSSLNQITSLEPNSPIAIKFKQEYFKLVLGTLSLPIDLPGTNYRQGFQGRKNIVKILTKLIEERRASKERGDDMLGCLLKEEDNKYKLSDVEMIDLMITIVYSGYETFSTTSMMAIKYLHDHPHVLNELRNEHLAIRKGKKADEAITWEDYKSMRFTRAVIFETSRLATVVNGVLRKTTQDLELNGYVIPKGWRIYVYTRETNYDPYYYSDPFTFNPWRWMEKSLESQPSFLLFGCGTRLCPGKELGIVEVSTFLHYMVTRYRWEEVEGNKLEKFPRVQAPNGLHFRITNC